MKVVSNSIGTTGPPQGAKSKAEEGAESSGDESTSQALDSQSESALSHNPVGLWLITIWRK